MIRRLDSITGDSCIRAVLPAPGRDTLVIVPVFGASPHMLRVVAGVLACTERTDLLMVVAGPHGRAGSIVTSLSALNERIHVLLGPGIQEAGAAYRAGFQWGLRRRYDLMVQGRPELCHDPGLIPKLLGQMATSDVVIGSRYCRRGAIIGTGRLRRLVSTAFNVLARTALRLPIADVSTDFICWRRGVLASLDLSRIHGHGLGFQVELQLVAAQLGARVREVPAVFVGHGAGVATASGRSLLKAGWSVVALTVLSLTGRRHPALGDPCVRPRPRAREAARRPRKRLFLALGGIGDTVTAFAAARRLRSLFPSDHLTALAMWPQSAELLADLGVFNEVLQHHFQKAPCWKSVALVLRLHRRRFDTSILAYPANRFEYNVVQWLIHARSRLGHEYLRGSNLTYLRWLNTDRIPQGPGTHNVLENLKLVDSLGSRRTANSPDASLGPLAPEYRVYAERLTAGTDLPLLGIHAGSSTYKNLHAKRWPVERFAELCNRASKELGLIPLLLGGEEDRTVNQAIRERCNAARAVDTPSIRHTAALIQQCSVFVSNDSALAHLASAVDVPTVMLVGPTDGLEVGPFASNGCVVSAPMNCAPCFRVSRAPLICAHPERFTCMKRISVDRVLYEVRVVLRSPRDQRSTAYSETDESRLNEQRPPTPLRRDAAEYAAGGCKRCRVRDTTDAGPLVTVRV